VAGVIARVWPEVPVSLSSEVAPEIREYPRTSTTVANAYVQPMMRRYLERLESAFAGRGFDGTFHLMLSSGGACTVDTATAFPIRLVESGAAAGALAAAFYCRLAGRNDVVAFDMGGTTAKVTLIHDGKPSLTSNLEVAREHRFKAGSGLPLQFPAIDLIEVGAGGGSIARIDTLGLLKSGPASAGADPGPACYNLGGTQPTVTDADLVLGYLNPDYFLGGEMPLSIEAAQEAIDDLAGQLGLERVEAAWGIHQLVNENMAAAARMHMIEKARDPRRYALLAFGGAGPLHAAGVANVLGASEVICPPAAGVASAVGLLAAPMSFEFARSYPVRLANIDWQAVNGLFEEMETQGRAMLAEAGIDQAAHVQRSVDGRFVGQLHEINVPLPGHPLGPDNREDLISTFKARYQQRYGHLPAEMPIEFLSWRTTVTGKLPPVNIPRYPRGEGDASVAQKGERLAYFPSIGDYVPTAVYDRYRLRPGMILAGPAIIEERECTSLVLPDWQCTVDKYLNLILRRK
jgi:N-methylhydantoinase A/oxoprolinase/acetone carboxylase beta subunit